MAEKSADKRGVRKKRQGVVLSRSGDKTATVQVVRRRKHPLYGKVLREVKKYHVHDEKNELVVGDKVRIIETRPLSRLKRWRVMEVLDRGRRSAVPELKEDPPTANAAE